MKNLDFIDQAGDKVLAEMSRLHGEDVDIIEQTICNLKWEIRRRLRG